ncbi:MAG: hypothetical protein MJZ07_05420 [Bacteroidales bacterium]|nr:hypothetical protein [Bacteroidales bacterium]
MDVETKEARPAWAKKIKLIERAKVDLGLNAAFEKGRDIVVRRCGHFYSDGNAVDAIFYDKDDFRAAMNRIYVVVQKYDVLILAFVLMDTHVHFILYGDYGECNRFVHEFMRRTSMYISAKYNERHKLDNLPISYQAIGNQYYLKVAICYTLKNPPVGGIHFNAYDYPWSSAALMFRTGGYWTSPSWFRDVKPSEASSYLIKQILRTHDNQEDNPTMIDGVVFPGEYVPVGLVEKLFKSPKGFNYFMCITRESDVESRNGDIARLSLPMQEMRQHKNEWCMKLFQKKDIRSLDTQQRLRLAKALRSHYNSSLKQIVRLCGLRYDEVKSLLQ